MIRLQDEVSSWKNHEVEFRIPQTEKWREDLGSAPGRIGHPALVKVNSQTISAEYDILLCRSLQCASSVDFVLVLP